MLPFLLKTFESLLNRQLVEYISNNKLLTDRQSGFRRGNNTTSTLLCVMGDVFMANYRIVDLTGHF